MWTGPCAKLSSIAASKSLNLLSESIHRKQRVSRLAIWTCCRRVGHMPLTGPIRRWGKRLTHSERIVGHSELGPKPRSGGPGGLGMASPFSPATWPHLAKRGARRIRTSPPTRAAAGAQGARGAFSGEGWWFPGYLGAKLGAGWLNVRTNRPASSGFVRGDDERAFSQGESLLSLACFVHRPALAVGSVFSCYLHAHPCR